MRKSSEKYPKNLQQNLWGKFPAKPIEKSFKKHPENLQQNLWGKIKILPKLV